MGDDMIMNNDLLSEILCRSPVKSVCVFRCVSKAWCSLISGKEFMEEYRARAQPILIDVGAGSNVNSRDSRDLRVIDLDGNVLRVFKGLGGGRTMCTSMDDLICVIGGFNDGVHVVDPATGKVLMRCPRYQVKGEHVRFYENFGFGRAAASGAYKVVRLLIDGTCEVLTVGEAGWRQRDSVPTDDVPEPISYQIPVAINGVLHFLASDEPSSPVVCLLCFDLESEQWNKKMIQAPEDVKVAHGRTISIAELNGALCMVVVEAMEEQYTEIWRLVDSDKSVWRKMYTIRENLCAPLRILPDGEKILLHYSNTQHEGRPIELDLVIYDTRTTICKDINAMPRGIMGLCSSGRLLSTKVV